MSWNSMVIIGLVPTAIFGLKRFGLVSAEMITNTESLWPD